MIGYYATAETDKGMAMLAGPYLTRSAAIAGSEQCRRVEWTRDGRHNFWPYGTARVQAERLPRPATTRLVGFAGVMSELT